MRTTTSANDFGSGGGPGLLGGFAGADGELGEGGQAQEDGGLLLLLSIDLGDLILGGGEAGKQSFDFAEPPFAFGFGDPVFEVVADLFEAGLLVQPWPAFDLLFRLPPTAYLAWALMDDRRRRVLELCGDVARDKTLVWLEESVVEIRWKAGGKQRARVKDGLIVAVFRHYESRATESRPLLHAHAVVSIRARRPYDGEWGTPYTHRYNC